MARRTFFSFHYQPDIWRAMNVRNSWVVQKDQQKDIGFFDGSVFEASKRESDNALKRFLREGLDNTSVTCVLAGTNTWERRWVRYEIARSVIKGNGILTVYIDGLKNRDGNVSVKGANPLDYMGVYRKADGIYLAEFKDSKWIAYNDYTIAIPERDLWFPPPTSNTVMQLSKYCRSYDFIVDDGRKNIGKWIETAAESAGR